MTPNRRLPYVDTWLHQSKPSPADTGITRTYRHTCVRHGLRLSARLWVGGHSLRAFWARAHASSRSINRLRVCPLPTTRPANQRMPDPRYADRRGLTANDRGSVALPDAGQTRARIADLDIDDALCRTAELTLKDFVTSHTNSLRHSDSAQIGPNQCPSNRRASRCGPLPNRAFQTPI
jgi:hypothetical protein